MADGALAWETMLEGEVHRILCGADALAVSGWRGVTGGPAAWIAQLDYDGTERWLRELGTVTSAEGLAESDGGYVVAGYSGDQLDNPEMALSRISSSGEVQWSMPASLPGSVGDARDVAVDSRGRVVVVGSADVGNGQAAWVGIHDGDGALLASFSFGVMFNHNGAQAVAIDGSDDVVAAGWTTRSEVDPNAAWVAKFEL